MDKLRGLALLLLLSALLSLPFSQGFGRDVHLIGRSASALHHEGKMKLARETQISVDDYGTDGPKANTNPRNGALFNPPTTPNPPPSH